MIESGVKHHKPTSLFINKQFDRALVMKVSTSYIYDM